MNRNNYEYVKLAHAYRNTHENFVKSSENLTKQYARTKKPEYHKGMQDKVNGIIHAYIKSLMPSHPPYFTHHGTHVAKNHTIPQFLETHCIRSTVHTLYYSSVKGYECNLCIYVPLSLLIVKFLKFTYTYIIGIGRS